MMVDNHVHYHVIPRYSHPVNFAGKLYEDKFWPKPPVLDTGDLGEIELLKIKEYLKHGAIGHISVCSIFEENYFLNLDSKLNFEYSNLPNPIGIKKKLKELGFSSKNLRLPLDF